MRGRDVQARQLVHNNAFGSMAQMITIAPTCSLSPMQSGMLLVTIYDFGEVNHLACSEFSL